MAEPKFKIGDYLVHKGMKEALRLFPAAPESEWLAPNKPPLLMVVGILRDECYAGVQTHYVCRMAWATGLNDQCIKILEIELDPAPTQPLTAKE